MKNVLITGVSRGLGFELAKIFLLNNYNVIGCCRDIITTKKRFEDFKNITLVKLDLNVNESFEEIESLIDTKFEIDILINNAGVYLEKDLKNTKISNIDLSLIENSMKTNFYAPLKLMRLVLSSMKNKKEGKIINVSSAWATYSLTQEIMDYSKSSAYRISKQLLNYSTLLMADELKDYPAIELNCVCPGWMSTDMGGKDAAKNGAKQASTSASEIYYLSTNNIGSGNFYKGVKISEW